MLNTLYGRIGIVVLAAVGLFSLIRGGPTERYAAAVVTLGWVASLAFQAVSGVEDPLFGFMAIDITAFLALLGLIWRSKQMWPLAAVGFQGLAAAVDLVRFTSPHMHVRGYLTALAVAAYGLLAAITVGICTASQEPARQLTEADAT